MRRFFRTLAWSIVFILGLTACAGPAQPPAPSGAGAGQAAATGPKRIVVAIRGDPLHLSSRIGGAGAGSVPGVDEVEHLINAGLVLTDHEGTYHPQLAMEVPTTENGLWKVLPDGRMEITWNLKEGIKWHDGAPFTSADLVFTARVEQDDDLEVIRNVAYRSVEAVEAPDPLTVRVLWKRPFIRAGRR